MSEKELKPEIFKVLVGLFDRNGKQVERNIYFTKSTVVPKFQMKFFEMQGLRFPTELEEESIISKIKDSDLKIVTNAPPDPFYPKISRYENHLESLMELFDNYQADGACNFYHYAQGVFQEVKRKYWDALNFYIAGSKKNEMYSMLKLAKIFLDPGLSDTFEVERDINRALEILVKCFAVNGLFDSYITGGESIHGVYILLLYCDCFPEIHAQACSMFAKFPVLDLLLNWDIRDPHLLDKFRNIEESLKYYPLILGDLLHPFFLGGVSFLLNSQAIREYYYKTSRVSSKPEKLNESKIVKNSRKESVLRDAIVCQRLLEEEQIPIEDLLKAGADEAVGGEGAKEKQVNLGSEQDYLTRVLSEGVLATADSPTVKIMDYDYLRFSLETLTEYEILGEWYVPKLHCLKNMEALSRINPDQSLLAFYFQLLYMRARYTNGKETENIIVELKNIACFMVNQGDKFKMKEHALCLEKGIGSKADLMTALNCYRRYCYEAENSYDLYYFSWRISRILLKNFTSCEGISDSFGLTALAYLVSSIQEEVMGTESLENDFTFKGNFVLYEKLFMLCKFHGQNINVALFLCKHFLLKELESIKRRKKEEELLLVKIRNFIGKHTAKGKKKGNKDGFLLRTLSAITNPSELSINETKKAVLSIVNELEELLALDEAALSLGSMLNQLNEIKTDDKLKSPKGILFKNLEISKTSSSSIGDLIKISTYDDIIIQNAVAVRLGPSYPGEECLIEGLKYGWITKEEALAQLRAIYEKKTHYFEANDFKIYEDGIFLQQQMDSSTDKKPEKSYMRNGFIQVQSLFNGVIVENQQKVLLNIIEVDLETEFEGLVRLLAQMDHYLQINSTFFLNIIGLNFQVMAQERTSFIINVFYEPFNIPLEVYPLIDIESKETETEKSEQRRTQMLKWFYLLLIEINAFFNSGRLFSFLSISNICLTLKHYPVVFDPTFEAILPVHNSKSRFIASNKLEIIKELAGEYLAPELMKAEKEMSEGEVTQSTVIWDLGLILYKILAEDLGKMVLSRTSFENIEVKQSLQDMVTSLAKRKGLDDSIHGVLKQMLDINPQKRLTIEHYIKTFEGILVPLPTKPDTGWLFLSEYMNCSFEEEIPRSERRIFLRGRKIFRGAFVDNYPNGHGNVEIKDSISYEGLLEQNSFTGNGVYRKKEFGFEYEFDGVFSFNLPGKGVVRKSRDSGKDWKVVSSREFINEEIKANPDFDGFEYMKRLPIPQYQMYLKKLISKCDVSDDNSRQTYDLIEKFMKKFEVFDLRQPVRLFDSESNFLIAPEDFKKFLIRKIDNLCFFFMFYCEEIDEKKIIYCDTFGFGLFELKKKPQPMRFPTEVLITKLRGFKYCFEGFKQVGRFLGGKFVSGLLSYFDSDQAVVKKEISEPSLALLKPSTFFDIPNQRVFKGFVLNGQAELLGKQYSMGENGEIQDLIYFGELSKGLYDGRGCLFRRRKMVFQGFFSRGLPVTGKFVKKSSKSLKERGELGKKGETDFELDGEWSLKGEAPVGWSSATDFLKNFIVRGALKTKDSIITKRIGQFTTVTDVQDLKGFYKFHFKNGNTYEGDVEWGTKNGKGTYIIKKPNGTLDAEFFELSLKCNFTLGAEVRIEGLWSTARESKGRDRFVCKVKGAIYWEKENPYEKTVGNFSFTDAGECTMEGFGLLFFRNGVKYIGELSDNKMTAGTMKYPSKKNRETYEKIYSGTFFEGKRDGFGELKEFLFNEEKVIKYVGLWKENKRDGFGMVFEESSLSEKPRKLYEGLFVKDVMARGAKFYHPSSPLLCVISSAFTKNEDKSFAPKTPAKIIFKLIDNESGCLKSVVIVDCCDGEELSNIDANANNIPNIFPLKFKGVKLTRHSAAVKTDEIDVLSVENEWIKTADEVFIGEMTESGGKDLTGYYLRSCNLKKPISVLPADTLPRVLFRNYALFGSSSPEIKIHHFRFQDGRERWERRKKRTFGLEIDLKSRSQWVGYFQGDRKIDGFLKGVRDVFSLQEKGKGGQEAKSSVLVEINSKAIGGRTMFQIFE